MKRQRSQSSSSSSSSRSGSESLTPAPTPSAKHPRPDPSSPSTSTHLICSLPPTCDTAPQTFPAEIALQSHYERCHSHVCRENGGCGKIFPEMRLLDLHITENHDPIAKVKQSQGEKIFECFLPRTACPKTFLTPKERRIHLIKAHHYPKEYFFSITNHGINDLLAKFGHGATLFRPAWRARGVGEGDGGGAEGGDRGKGVGNGGGGEGGPGLGEGVGRAGSGSDGMLSGEEEAEPSRRKGSNKSKNRLASPPPSGSIPHLHPHSHLPLHAEPLHRESTPTDPTYGPPPSSDPTHPNTAMDPDTDMDALISGMSSASLGFVPKAVRKKAKAKEKMVSEIGMDIV